MAKQTILVEKTWPTSETTYEDCEVKGEEVNVWQTWISFDGSHLWRTHKKISLIWPFLLFIFGGMMTALAIYVFIYFTGLQFAGLFFMFLGIIPIIVGVILVILGRVLWKPYLKIPFGYSTPIPVASFFPTEFRMTEEEKQGLAKWVHDIGDGTVQWVGAKTEEYVSRLRLLPSVQNLKLWVEYYVLKNRAEKQKLSKGILILILINVVAVIVFGVIEIYGWHKVGVI